MLRPGEEGKLAALKASPDMTARMLADLKAGQIVVASAGGEIGWWRIDPVTGTTLGMGANGTGAAMVEYALVILIQTIISVAQCMVSNAATAAIERYFEGKDAGEGVVESARGAYKAGTKEAAESYADSEKNNHRRCYAVGLMGGIDAGLMMASFKLSSHIALKLNKLMGFSAIPGGGLPLNPGGSGGAPGGSGKPPPGKGGPVGDGGTSGSAGGGQKGSSGGQGSSGGGQSGGGKGADGGPSSGQKGNKDGGQNRPPGENKPPPRDKPLVDQMKDAAKKEKTAGDEKKKLDDLVKKNDRSEQGQKELQDQRERSKKSADDWYNAEKEVQRDLSRYSESVHEYNVLQDIRKNIREQASGGGGDGGNLPPGEQKAGVDQYGAAQPAPPSPNEFLAGLGGLGNGLPPP
jgi:Flp pilus assembly pilin Flp